LVTTVKPREYNISVPSLMVEDDFDSRDLRDLFIKMCVKLRVGCGGIATSWRSSLPFLLQPSYGCKGTLVTSLVLRGIPQQPIMTFSSSHQLYVKL